VALTEEKSIQKFCCFAIFKNVNLVPFKLKKMQRLITVKTKQKVKTTKICFKN
jgi:hypothetical protein